jgi:hypothetical protein
MTAAHLPTVESLPPAARISSAQVSNAAERGLLRRRRGIGMDSPQSRLNLISGHREVSEDTLCFVLLHRSSSRVGNITSSQVVHQRDELADHQSGRSKGSKCPDPLAIILQLSGDRRFAFSGSCCHTCKEAISSGEAAESLDGSREMISNGLRPNSRRPAACLQDVSKSGSSDSSAST